MTKEVTNPIFTFASVEELQRVLEELSIHTSHATLMMEQTAVNIAGKIGFVNWTRCKIIAHPIYDAYFGEYSYENPFICIKRGGKWGVLNYDGFEEIPPCCTERIAILIRLFLNNHITISPEKRKRNLLSA